MEETKVHEHIVRIIVLIKGGYCMGTEEIKHTRIIPFGNKS